MAPTERADRLERLRAELAQAAQSERQYTQFGREAMDQSYEDQPLQAQFALRAHAFRLKGQAASYAARRAELVKEIAALEASSAQAAPAVTAEQRDAMDDTHNFRAEVV